MNRLLRKKEAGGVIVIATIVAAIMMVLGAAFFLVTLAFVNSVEASVTDERTLQVAEAGIDIAIQQLNSGYPAQIALGTCGHGKYTVSAAYWGTDGADNDSDGQIDETDEQGIVVVTSIGAYGTRMRRLEGVLHSKVRASLMNAIYAGNSSGDPNYSLDFRGVGDQGDHVVGDVYSGQDMAIEQDAEVDGTVRAAGTINGQLDNSDPLEAPTGDNIRAIMASHPGAIVDVNTIFANQGVSAYDVIKNERYGGTVVPEESVAHILRLNPDDRAFETSTTVGPDFFLEDPYEVNAQGKYNVNNTPISISSAQTGDPEEGNDRIYYIRGNLWLHNRDTYDFVPKHPEKTGIHNTFVVEGNIYFSDNLFKNNPTYDVWMFIAIKDPNNPDTTGNVTIGDPIFGTVEELNTLLYAENNFLDNNLDEQGSYHFTINGNMTGGNHVQINRDYDTRPYHSRMDVNFDGRLNDTSRQAQKFRENLPPFFMEMLTAGPSTQDLYWLVSYRELSRPSYDPFSQHVYQ